MLENQTLTSLYLNLYFRFMRVCVLPILSPTAIRKPYKKKCEIIWYIRKIVLYLYNEIRAKDARQMKVQTTKNSKTMKATAKNIQAVSNEVNNTKTRSAWSNGVKAYAFHILAHFEEWQRLNESEGLECPDFDEVTALNGAQDWSAWAYGGCGLVYDNNIAVTLCTASEREKWHKRGCPNMANPRETWLDVEARAAHQAWRMIAEAVRKLEA